VKKNFLLLILIFGAAILAASFNFKGNDVFATVPGNNTHINGQLLTPDGKNIISNTAIINLGTGLSNAINVSTLGVQANNSISINATSETGRYIIYESSATNLIDGSTIPSTYYQLYLRDTLAHTTTLISQDNSGSSANATVQGLGVSEDGRFVLFQTSATNLFPGAPTGYNLYRLDRSTNSIKLLNRNTNGTAVAANSTNPPVGGMSCDGSIVTFQFPANLISGTSPTNHVDIYLLDLRSDDKLVNLTANANNAGTMPTISCNGDYIGFESWATNLDTSVTRPTGIYHQHAIVYNRIDGSFSTADQYGGTSGNADSCATYQQACINNTSLAISDNGIAIFSSAATNLSSLASTGQINTYIHNLATGETQILNQTSAGTLANGDSQYLNSISMDGRSAVYTSLATNLTGNTGGILSLTGY